MNTDSLKQIFNNKIIIILIFTFLSAVIFALSLDNGMFWDNVLFASKMGNHLYNTSLLNWYIPDTYDPGHPPTLGFLLAILWKIFGHKLWVSHLLMIPFSVGLLYQIYLLVSFYIKKKLIVFLGLFLIIVDPTLSTQFVIVNPELIQLFFFFLAINSILYKKSNLKIIALIFLSIISFRSMMLCAGVFLFDFSNSLLINKQKLKSILTIKFITTYLIGSIPALIYIAWRLIEKGWIQTHPSSPWVNLWHLASIKEIIRNIIILGHRYTDFGRIFIYIFIIYNFIKFKNNIFTKNVNQLILLSITSIITIIVTSILTTNSFGHRYFIVSYIVLTLLAFVILSTFYKRKKIIYSFLLLSLITGNLWIYPRNIAQGWDATLAHLPYYNLRTEAINYLDKKSIEIEDVGTFFPNVTKIDNVDLSGDMRSFTSFNGQNNYLFYSNVYNLSDEEYEIIDTKYTLVKQFNKFNIDVNIYKHK